MGKGRVLVEKQVVEVRGRFLGAAVNDCLDESCANAWTENEIVCMAKNTIFWGKTNKLFQNYFTFQNTRTLKNILFLHLTTF